MGLTAIVEVAGRPTDAQTTTTPPAAASSAKGVAPTSGPGVLSAMEAFGGGLASAIASDVQEEEEGLGKSDVIALATGLGVGIPSLAIDALELWFQLRRRRNSTE